MPTGARDTPVITFLAPLAALPPLAVNSNTLVHILQNKTSKYSQDILSHEHEGAAPKVPTLRNGCNILATDAFYSDAARDGGLTTVVVDQKEYKVHTALPKQYSKYFQNALEEWWAEAEKEVIRLEDVDCHTCMSSILLARKTIDADRVS